MDLPPDEPFDAIASVPTVEVIGQGFIAAGNYCETFAELDREAPLRTIPKIYSLLSDGGAALVTVPDGRLSNGPGCIQFSQEYLDLLTSKYCVPAPAVKVHALRRTALETIGDRPWSLWEEAEPASLAEVEYNLSWPAASAIAVVELVRTEPAILSTSPREATVLDYAMPVVLSGPHLGGFHHAAPPDADGVFHVSEAGAIFFGPHIDLGPGLYDLGLQLTTDLPCRLEFDVVANDGDLRLLAWEIRRSSEWHGTFTVPTKTDRVQFRLISPIAQTLRVTVPQLVVRRAD